MRKPDAVITLDLPPRSSHANARPGNWKAKAFPAQRYAKKSGEIVWSHAVELGRPQWTAVTIRLTFVLPELRKRGNDQRHDPDNLISWAKKPLDLLTEAGILADDRDVIYLPPVQKRAKDPMQGHQLPLQGMTIEIWRRRVGECPFCGAQELTGKD